jgi:hypothetical protein
VEKSKGTKATTMALKLTEDAKEVLIMCHQRGHEHIDVLCAGLLALARLGQRDQDKLIGVAKTSRETPPPDDSQV